MEESMYFDFEWKDIYDRKFTEIVEKREWKITIQWWG